MAGPNLKQRAYAHIREQIIDGRIGAGERISELRLAKDIGISRTPVREAVNLLTSEGLLEMVPGFGAFVPLPDVDDLRELFGLREALECYAVQEAASRPPRELIAHLEECCRRHIAGIRKFKASGRRAMTEEIECLIGESDLAFHRALLESSNNRWVLKIVSDLRLMSRVLARKVDPSQENLLTVLVFVHRCHRRVLAAIRRGDGAAAAHWMRVHIRDGCDRFLRMFETSKREDLRLFPSLRRAISRLEHFDTRPSRLRALD